MEMREASEALKLAEERWAKLDAKAEKRWAHPDADPRNLCEWFDALEARYQADKKLWLLFVGKYRSPKSNKMYCEYRKMLLSGKKLRGNA